MDQDRFEEPVPTGLFAALPDAILSLILFGLDVRSICSLACCSRPLRVWAQQEVLWQHMMLDGALGPIQFKVTAMHAATENLRGKTLSCARSSKAEYMAGWYQEKHDADKHILLHMLSPRRVPDNRLPCGCCCMPTRQSCSSSKQHRILLMQLEMQQHAATHTAASAAVLEREPHTTRRVVQTTPFLLASSLTRSCSTWSMQYKQQQGKGPQMLWQASSQTSCTGAGAEAICASLASCQLWIMWPGFSTPASTKPCFQTHMTGLACLS